MSDQTPNLMKYRPFQIVWVWDTLCIIAGVTLYTMTENLVLLIGLILAGGIPLVLVLRRFSAESRQGAPDRSKDLVQ